MEKRGEEDASMDSIFDSLGYGSDMYMHNEKNIARRKVVHCLGDISKCGSYYLDNDLRTNSDSLLRSERASIPFLLTIESLIRIRLSLYSCGK